MDGHIMQNQVVNFAIDYIIRNIGSEQKVDDVARACGYSPYYLERLFKAETGESIYSFMKRMKVEQSAFHLKIEREYPVSTIGEEYGYSSSNYATLFKKHFGRTPASFRKQIHQELRENSFFHEPASELWDYEACSKKIKVVQNREYFVLYERRKGNYHNLVENWQDFLQKYRTFIGPDTVFLEITYEDPSIASYDSCLYDICMTVDREDPRLTYQKTAAVGITSRVQSGTVPNTMTIPKGTYAVYRYKGYPELIYKAYQSVFCNWLSRAGYRIDHRIGYDLYRRIEEDTLYMELDICIPVREK